MDFGSHSWAPSRPVQPNPPSPPRSNSDGGPYEIKLKSTATPGVHELGDESFEQLRYRIKSLESENKALKYTHDPNPRWETLYFIQGQTTGQQAGTFLDEPTWVIGPRNEVLLKARFPIGDIDGYLRQKHDVAFVVAKWYHPKFQEEEVEQAARDKKPLPLPKCTTETVRLHSKDMIAAAEDFFGRKLGFLEKFPDLDIRASLPAPYLFWYYHRKSDEGDPFETLSPLHRDLMRLLTGWIDKNYGTLYDHAEAQLKRGKVSFNTMGFLVRPGDVVVIKENRTASAAIAKAWLNPVTPREQRQGFTAGRRATDWTRNPHTTTAVKPSWKWSLKCWSYKYDGQFIKNDQVIDIVLETEDPETEIDICEMQSFPLQYADKWREVLQTRGRTFWSCRSRRLVSYHDDSGMYGVSLENLHSPSTQQLLTRLQNGDRFMIDFDTYRQLHSDSAGFKREYQSINDPKCEHMDPSMMSLDEPPSGAEINVFPRTIIGYNLRSKKWGTS